MMERLARRGFITALVTYRLSTEAKFPAALYDCKSAIRFMRANAAKPTNPEKIGIMEGSAGGHLSALTALTSGKKEYEGPGPNRDQDSSVRACIVMAATQDLLEANIRGTSESAEAFFGTSCAASPELYRKASPINHIRKGVPPQFLSKAKKTHPKSDARSHGKVPGARP